MPSKSKAQARLMAACAHGANYDSCPPGKVAREFNQADKGSGILKKRGGGVVRPGKRDSVGVAMAMGGAVTKYPAKMNQQLVNKRGLLRDKKYAVGGAVTKYPAKMNQQLVNRRGLARDKFPTKRYAKGGKVYYDIDSALSRNDGDRPHIKDDPSGRGDGLASRGRTKAKFC